RRRGQARRALHESEARPNAGVPLEDHPLTSRRRRGSARRTEMATQQTSMYAVVDPTSGETLKQYDTITDDELRAAIDRADRAHRTWSKATSVAERAALVRRVGELHVERREALAEIIVREMGKPIEQALGEVDFVGS